MAVFEAVDLLYRILSGEREVEVEEPLLIAHLPVVPLLSILFPVVRSLYIYSISCSSLLYTSIHHLYSYSEFHLPVPLQLSTSFGMLPLFCSIFLSSLIWSPSDPPFIIQELFYNCLNSIYRSLHRL